MPRTENWIRDAATRAASTNNCPSCGGSGSIDTLTGPSEVCEICAGNGFVTVVPAENDEVAPLLDPPADLDLTDDTPPPGRMANQTWRILEEQRMAAEETIRECDAEIERWAKKRDDTIKTKGMCEAGQRALDGGSVMDFLIVCNDGGEMKTIKADEFLAAVQGILVRTDVEKVVDTAINEVLDKRAIAAGEYDPSDNDTPMLFTVGGDHA